MSAWFLDSELSTCSLVYFVGLHLLRNDLKETGDMAISVLLVKQI